MRMRTRKIVGTFILLGFIIVWAFLGMFIGMAVQEHASGLLQGLYYLAVGCLWAVPAMPILKWMLKPDTA